MKNRRFIKRADTQRGAVLVVSLLLLLVMTLLGLGASQSTRLQERMAGNQRDLELAMQSAEASLRAGEALLAPERVTIVTCVSANTICEAYEAGTLVDANGLALDLTRQSDDWWLRFGRRYEFASSLSQISKTPDYVNERVAESRDTLSQGGSYITVVRDFHRSTARSTGLTTTAQAVVQSTYSRVGFE
jgi:type IV pilus assembly protein PilX